MSVLRNWMVCPFFFQHGLKRIQNLLACRTGIKIDTDTLCDQVPQAFRDLIAEIVLDLPLLVSFYIRREGEEH